MLREIFHIVFNKKPLPFIKKIEDSGNAQIIRLKGAIDTFTIPDVEKLLWATSKKQGHLNKNIIVDFKDVNHVDSATIAALLEALTVIKHERHTLALINVDKKFKSMLEITKVDKLFAIYDSEEKALSELS